MTEIVADDMIMLDGRGGGAGAGQADESPQAVEESHEPSKDDLPF